MIEKHPTKFMVAYLILFLWNGAAAIVPGGTPMWLSATMASLMGLLAIRCYVVRRYKSTKDEQ